MSTENKKVESIPAITIRFAGDSGDGMQLVGTRFTDTSAVFGNDLATLPAFPAEIRATSRNYCRSFFFSSSNSRF